MLCIGYKDCIHFPETEIYAKNHRGCGMDPLAVLKVYLILSLNLIITFQNFFLGSPTSDAFFSFVTAIKKCVNCFYF